MDKLSMLISLEGDDQGLKAAVDSASASFERLKTDGQEAGERISAGLGKAQEAAQQIAASLPKVSSLFSDLRVSGTTSAEGISTGLTALQAAVEKTKTLLR
ncbi:hypothetical protein CCP4SC76_3090001 [Gammaproteobacteria bacterium]